MRMDLRLPRLRAILINHPVGDLSLTQEVPMPAVYRILILVMLSVSANAVAEPFFDFSASTPEGGWALREVTTTDHKGRQTVLVIKQKYLGSEQREGQAYYWLESEMDSYKLKKGQRKREGEHTVVKALVPQTAMSSDPANVLNNLQGFGQEIILQTGDSQPLLITGGGKLAGVALKSMGVKVNYQFTVEGTETINTAAGTFKAKRVTGTGNTSAKILFKKIEMQSQSVLWISEEVPFGIVQSESTDIINGKEQRSKTVLLDYGRSGAKTAITGEVIKMPF